MEDMKERRYGRYEGDAREADRILFLPHGAAMIDHARRPQLLVWLLLALLLASCTHEQAKQGGRLDAHIALAWTYAAGGAIHQPPLLVGDLVIVAPAGGPLTALDARTGRTRWQFAPAEGLWERAVAADARRIFVGLKGRGFAALDAGSGRVLWQQALGIECQMPPLVYGDTLYIPTTFVGPELDANVAGRAQLLARNARNGQPIWTFETGNYILQTPERRGDTIYVGGNFADPQPIDEGGHVRIYALDARDATVRWTYEAEDGFPKRLHAAAETLVFVGYQDFLNGIDAGQGVLRWRRDTGNWTPTFLGADDAIYSSAANTTVARLDANSGALIWQFNIPGGSFNYLLGAATLQDDVLLFLTQQGDIHALDAATGASLWHVETGVVAARTGLSAAGGWLFFGDAAGTVYAYSSPEGS